MFTDRTAILTEILVLSLILFLICSLPLFGQTAIEPSGEGTSDNPYKITRWENLYWLSQQEGKTNENGDEYWSLHYKQTDDIAFPQSGEDDIHDWDSGKGFSPIGTWPDSGGTEFKGVYDGNGYTISNLYINRDNENKIGLFGVLKKATIKDLGLLNVDVTGGDRTGGLVGRGIMEETIQNTYVTGSVTGNNHVGGLMGWNDGTVSESYSTTNVTGNETIGGLVGASDYQASVYNSYSTGSVSGLSGVGGLIGRNEDPSSLVQNCYSTGKVSGEILVGGLIADNKGEVSASFWDKETSDQTSSDGGIGKTTEEMKQKSTFTEAGWTFNEDNWAISDGASRPFVATQNLKVDNGIPSTKETRAKFPAGNIHNNSTIAKTLEYGYIYKKGTSPTWEDSLREKVAEGVSVSAGSNQTIEQTELTGLETKTIYYARAYVTDGTSVWLGEEVSFNTYPDDVFSGGTGTLDDPYLIDSLDDLRTLSEKKFYWDKHFIQTEDIDASPTKDWNNGKGFYPIGTHFYSGTAFMGTYDGNGHTISGLYIDRGDTNLVGLFGFIGEKAKIKNLGLESVNISGNGNVGGLTGQNFLGTISNSYSKGSVSGEQFVGGLVGFNMLGGKISNSYSHSDITRSNGTKDSFGLLCGGNASTVEYSYSTGKIDAGTIVDDFIGIEIENEEQNIEPSYTSNFLHNPDQESATGATSVDTEAMKTKSTFTEANWNFDTIWSIDSETNDGYPFLTQLNSTSTPTATFGYSLGSSSDQIEVTFDASDSYDPDGFIDEYKWDWEDDGSFDAVTSSEVITHTFDNFDSFTVRLKVVDNDGAADVVEKKVASFKVQSILNHGPNPVPSEGCIFWFDLPEDTERGLLRIYDIDGRPLFETEISSDQVRYPEEGRWNLREANGKQLGNGIYMYRVKVNKKGGSTIWSDIQKLVIDRRQ